MTAPGKILQFLPIRAPSIMVTLDPIQVPEPILTSLCIVEKGSITIDGTSLTVVDSGSNSFSVAIIPYTYENTRFNTYKKGTVVNLEFDVIGKYVAKLMSL
jgi:riboflavin synthase alpha subunit